MNDIVTNGQTIGLPHIMKRLNFVEDVNRFVRKFTVIIVENNELYIGHTWSGHTNTKTKIELEHLNEWINHFDKI